MHNDESEFPFEFWAKLAQDDPGAFEDARRLMIDSLIEAAPTAVQPRLRGLQWQIEHIRNRAPTALSACLKISDMMWTNVLGEDGLAARLTDLGEGSLVPPPTRPAADVLPFRRPQPEAGDVP
ncbi:MAG: DUF3135 domain-containing protein [Gammaproteobacteria bacterium]